MSVWSRIWRRGRADATPRIPASIPAGRRVYAIGDVHGELAPLERLLAKLRADRAVRGPAETTLIFLGDLIDRGPESAGVVALALELAEGGADVRFLMGNHEEVFLSALEGRKGALRAFLRIGGAETLASYGIGADALEMPEQAMLARVRTHVPARHRDFLAGFEDLITIGDYAFVHAGIRPGVALDHQTASDLRWIREPFLSHGERHSHVIVHGHTIRKTVQDRGNRIGIDTGAYRTGLLTALGLEGRERWLLQATA